MSHQREEVDVPGATVKIFCEANPDYYLTAREYDDVILAPGDESNPHQQWIMDCTWGIKVKDGAGFPAFALVNKATRQALRHGIEAREKVHTCPYSKELNEAILWTQSDDVGEGYKCIRPVDNTDLNLDAYHGDAESGGIQDGTDLILFRWKKQQNQKWKIIPIFNPVSQADQYGEGGTNYGAASYEQEAYGSGATNYVGAPFGEAPHGSGSTNYGGAPFGEAPHGSGATNYAGAPFGETPYGSGATNYGGAPYGEGVINCGRPGYEGGTNYQEDPAYVTHHHHEPERTNYQDEAYVAHAHHENEFRIPEGQVVRIYCEQSPDFFLTVRNQEVVLAIGDSDDVSQHWIKVDEWGNKVRDEAGFPAFALVNKANLKALKHGSQEWDKVELIHYNPDDFDESILWSQSADVGQGYQCIRPVTEISLNLDAKLADGKYGNVEDGNELILFKWKKQKNQKWKMLPVD